MLFIVNEHLAIQLIYWHATQIWKQILQIENNMLKIRPIDYFTSVAEELNSDLPRKNPS